VCRHKSLAEQWVRGIFDAILFCNEVERNKTLKDAIPKRMRILDDSSGKTINLNEQAELKPQSETASQSRAAIGKKDSIFKRNTGSVSGDLKPPAVGASSLTSSQVQTNNSKSFQ